MRWCIAAVIGICVLFSACGNPLVRDLTDSLFEKKPVIVSTPAGLAAIANNLGGNYKLTADINLPGNWKPIGTADAPFTGTFNGNGHTVTVNGFDFAASGNSKGLFDETNGANIEDLTINMNVSQTVYSSVNREYIGGISSYDEGSTFSRITVTGNVNLTIDISASGSRIYLAGIVSSCRRSTFENCYADVNLTLDASTNSTTQVGGITNLNEMSGSTEVVVIKNCLYAGSINVDMSRGTSYANVGGILGSTHSSVTTNITNCAVVSPSLVYKVNSPNNGSIQRIVSGTSAKQTVSGCVAKSPMTITKNGIAVSITDNANDIDGASKTAAELLQQSTYSGWNFTSIWKMGANWPVLR